MTFDETPPPYKTSPLVDDDLDDEEEINITEKKNLENDIEDETLEIEEIVNIKESRNHPLENVIGNLNQRTLRNKLDKNDIVSRNKVRLVAQGYNQQEGVDYDETYAPVARPESIWILLAYACALDFKLFQMDVKSAFLNNFINEEVYVAQPLGFIDFEKPNHIYKLKKALYDLKQAPKACQYQLNYSDEGQIFIEFVIQNQFFSYSLEEFAQILGIPCKGACVFTDKWSLDELAYGVPMDSPYQTNPPSSDDIILSIRIDQEGQSVASVMRKKLMFLNIKFSLVKLCQP
nr:retrovirus-related Pol polyprotein from transposon TNT 1-94 [Tanacetum cinerariifolium]